MYSRKTLFLAFLALASGSHAVPEGNCKRANAAKATPVTVTNILPTKSVVSPEDAVCTKTYTTVLPGLATDAEGNPTGVAPHTYTMAFGCDGSSDSPCILPPSPGTCPPGFKTTTAVCDTCADGPVTYTLTVPETAAATGHPSGNPPDSGKPEHVSGASSSPEIPGNSESPGPVPTKESEITPDVADTKGGQPTGENEEGETGNAGGNDEDSSGKVVEVSAASEVRFDLKKAAEMLLMSAVFLGLNM